MARTPPPNANPAPTPPIQRGDRATFSDRVDATITYLTAAPANINAIATNAYNNAVDAFTSAGAANQSAITADQKRGEAATAAGNALTYRNEAQGFRNEAEGFKNTALGAVDSLTATSTTSNVIGTGNKIFSGAGLAGKSFKNSQRLRASNPTNVAQWMEGPVTGYTNNGASSSITLNITDVNSATAGNTVANWSITIAGERGSKGDAGSIAAGGTLIGALNEAKAPNVTSTVSPVDIWSGAGNLIDLTGAGTVTGFTNAPQAGARRTLIVSGTPTLVTSASMIVYGGTQSLVPGDLVDVIAGSATEFRVTIRRRDGKATVGTRLVVEVITASQMWTVKSTDFEVEMCGGGQSGRGSSYGGGWCGAYAKKNFTGATIGTTASITVGAGGAATTNATRSDGGNSSFALPGFTTITCEGGKDAGAAASGGDININGVPGDAYSIAGVSLYGNEFVGVYRSGAGASCPLGNGAPCGITTPVNGSGYGAGGAGPTGAAETNGAYKPVLLGSAGRPGVCIIRYYV